MEVTEVTEDTEDTEAALEAALEEVTITVDNSELKIDSSIPAFKL